MLEAQTIRVEVDGVQRYATPLLRIKDMPTSQAPKESVMSHLRGSSYPEEIQKLEKVGYVIKIPSKEVELKGESWYLPHHLVTHNGKDRVVFNCSYTYDGRTLNKLLLPGPTLGPTLLGVLIRFRQH